MRRQILHKTTSVTPYKWGAYLLLFVFAFSTIAIYYSNICTYSKQQIYNDSESESEADLSIYEELAEKDGIDFPPHFDYFIHSEKTYLNVWGKIHFGNIRLFFKCPAPPFQNIPLFIKNQVFRL